MVEKQDVLTQLDEVEDPELNLSIVELGLVYDVRFELFQHAINLYICY